MTWTVFYRDNTGEKVSTVIEASSRSELFKVLSDKKINAISVTEGIVKTSAAKRTGGACAAKKAPKGLLVALTAVLAIGCACYLVFLAIDSDGSEPKVSETKDAKPAKLDLDTVPNGAKLPVAPTQDVTTAIKKEAAKLKPGSVTTNRFGQEVRVNKDGSRTAVSTAWARRLKEQKENPPKRVFKHIAEGYMALFLNPGQSVPPPPDVFTDEDVRNMLATKIEIDRVNDTEDEIRQKEGVIAMKEELVTWLQDGGTFQSYLNELQKRQDHEAAEMTEARSMIMESLQKGDIEDARMAYDKINEYFKGKHMPKVNIAPKYRKLLEQRQ